MYTNMSISNVEKKRESGPFRVKKQGFCYRFAQIAVFSDSFSIKIDAMLDSSLSYVLYLL